MKKSLAKVIIRFGIIGELLGFLWGNKLWWAIPIIIVMLLLVLLLFFGQTTGFAPFIYPLF